MSRAAGVRLLLLAILVALPLRAMAADIDRLFAAMQVDRLIDVMRDEGLAYVERLKAAGIPHRHEHFPDMLHAFLNMEELVSEECEAVYRTMAEFLNAG